MPHPRSSQISLSDTPLYHCVCRCVRRSFLCGEDTMTGQNYEHRQGWVEKRLRLATFQDLPQPIFLVLCSILAADRRNTQLLTDNQDFRNPEWE